jgi:pyruvate dehydrogenase E1 component alpha subunit
MDVIDVYKATVEAAARAREGEGPSLIEAITYRFRGHSMSDPAEYRSKREERIWQDRDPIKNLRRRLLGERHVPESRLEAIDREIVAVIDDAVKFADESPEPQLSDLTRHVYVD